MSCCQCGKYTFRCSGVRPVAEQPFETGKEGETETAENRAGGNLVDLAAVGSAVVELDGGGSSDHVALGDEEMFGALGEEEAESDGEKSGNDAECKEELPGVGSTEEVLHADDGAEGDPGGVEECGNGAERSTAVGGTGFGEVEGDDGGESQVDADEEAAEEDELEGVGVVGEELEESRGDHEYGVEEEDRVSPPDPLGRHSDEKTAQNSADVEGGDESAPESFEGGPVEGDAVVRVDGIVDESFQDWRGLVQDGLICFVGHAHKAYLEQLLIRNGRIEVPYCKTYSACNDEKLERRCLESGVAFRHFRTTAIPDSRTEEKQQRSRRALRQHGERNLPISGHAGVSIQP